VTLPKPPDIKLFPLEKSQSAGRDFLTLRREWYELAYPNLDRSIAFRNDSVERRAMDAVTIIAHHEVSGIRQLYIRSCIRPSLNHLHPELVNLWELAAGLVEKGEHPAEAAMRECEEELGFKLPVNKFTELGDFMLPTPGMCAERIFFYEVEVDPKEQGEPTLDGGPLEKHGEVRQVSLDSAVQMVLDGKLPDAKTQLGIWRMLWKYKMRRVI